MASYIQSSIAGILKMKGEGEKKGKRSKYGYCKLTNLPGKMAKSHILPKSISRPSKPGVPLVQYGPGHAPSQRWDSWYDTNLVTLEGEKILSDIDDFGVAELRRLKLIWSAWDSVESLGLRSYLLREDEGLLALFEGFGDTHRTLEARVLESTDIARFRRFLVSILWRILASDMKEFRDISVPAEPLEAVRAEVLGGGPCHEIQFSPYLVQLTSKAKFHNRTPTFDTLELPVAGPDGVGIETAETIRVYLDGLIIHFIYTFSAGFPANHFKYCAIRSTPEFLVATKRFEDSKSSEQLEEALASYLQARAMSGRVSRD